MALGNKSRTQLATCQPELKKLFEEVSAGVDRGECPGVKDITVLCGFRDKRDQDKAFAEGKSKLRWPQSKHNKMPSLAVDVVPYPVNWLDHAAFMALRAYVLLTAERLGYNIRIISWDWPHYELNTEASDGAPTTRRGVG